MDNKKKHLIVNVGEKLHKDIKFMALNQGITVKTWILRAISDKMMKENENNKNKQQ